MAQHCQWIWFRSFLLAGWLLIGGRQPVSIQAQGVGDGRERASFWATKGQNLMKASQYAEAYTAFQLARSLGAPHMATQMELAKKRNINSIQYRALTAEARARAITDPTQSLRLLEYAHQKFPDSLSVLKLIGEVANIPDNWYYTLRARDIQASPGFTYLLAETDKTRLYLRRGDSLTLVHSFAERIITQDFSSDNRFLLIGTLIQARLYALEGKKIRLVRIFDESVETASFSPIANPAYGAWLLIRSILGRTTLYSLQSTAFSRVVSKSTESEQETKVISFSPGGRYLITPAGVWQLTVNQIRPVPVTGDTGWGEIPTHYSRFSNDDRHLLITKNEDVSKTSASRQLAHYRFSERGDSLYYVADFQARMDLPRKLWQPFSSNNRYLTYNDSLFFVNGTKQELVRPVTKSGQNQPLESNPNEGPEFGADFRFSPTNTHVIREVRDTSLNPVFQLWRLDGANRFFVYQFTDKASFADDMFSPDGKYLLSRHTATDILYRVEADTVLLVHRFSHSTRKPTMNIFDEDGYPKASLYFSPASRYLLTYGANLKTADSLWQLPQTTADGLLPIYGFKNRLQEGYTVFSPDDRFLLTLGGGLQPATVWNLAEQLALQSNQLTPPTQALFAPQGNFLLTNGPKRLWRVTDRQLMKLPYPSDSVSLTYYQFSANEQYLMKSQKPQFIQDSTQTNETILYRLGRDSLTQLRRYWTPAFSTSNDAENLPYLATYQSGLFSPDGTQWLQGLSVSSPDQPTSRAQPDTVWNLTNSALGRAGLSFSMRPANRIDQYTIENPETFTLKAFSPSTFFVNWHSRPAALFSRDGRFLLTKELDSLRFYQLKPNLLVSGSLAPKRGFPLGVSANAEYWLTGSASSYEPASESNPDTPDSVWLWRRTGPNLKPTLQVIAVIGGLYKGMNRYWHGNRRQSLFSMTGNYLLLPTTQPAITTLYTLVGSTIRPVLNLNDLLLTASYLPPDPQNGWDVGLLYSNVEQQTYMFQYGPASTRTLPLGFGKLELPPQFRGHQAYWVRKIDDSQQQLELLDMPSGQTLVQVPFGAVRDFTVRPNGDAWVVSTEGARLIRSPLSTLRWLKKAPIAPLLPALRQTYSVL